MSMEKNLVCVVLVLCISGSMAVWNLNKVPDFLQSVMKNEKGAKFLKNLLNSNQAEYVRENLDEGKDRFLKNILRFGTRQIDSSFVGDQGHATNCGPPSHNFTLTWEPKEPTSSNSLKITFNMAAPEKLSNGLIDLIAYMDGTPVVEEKLSVCDYIQKVGLKCPILKGQKISMTKTVADISMLPPTTYKIRAKVIGDKSDVFLCAELMITIKD